MKTMQPERPPNTLDPTRVTPWPFDASLQQQSPVSNQELAKKTESALDLKAGVEAKQP